MPKTLLYFTLAMVICLTACKKSATTDTNDNSAILSLQTKLEAGKGTWKLGAFITTYYDKNNVVLKTFSSTSPGYWVFSKEYYTNTNFHLYYWGKLNDPNTIDPIPYSLSQESGTYYITFPGNKSKYRLQTLTETNITLISSDVLQLNFFDGTKTVTADHATSVENLVKYE